MSINNSVSTVAQQAATAPPPQLPMDPGAFYQLRQLSEMNAPPPVQMTSHLFDWLESSVGFAALVLVVLLVTRLIQSFMLHRSINKSIEANSGHTESLIDKVDKPLELIKRGGAGVDPADDRNGLVLVAIGLAMAGFGIVQGDEETIRMAIGAALFPLFVGIALLVRRRLLKREQSADRG